MTTSNRKGSAKASTSLPSEQDLTDKLRVMIRTRIRNKANTLEQTIDSYLSSKILTMIALAMGFSEEYGRMEIKDKSPINARIRHIADVYAEKYIRENQEKLFKKDLTKKMTAAIESRFIELVRSSIDDRLESIAEEHVEREIQTMIRKVVGPVAGLEIEND